MYRLVTRATDATCLWMSCIQLAADSHSVVAMRLMGMGGAWSTPRDEASAMMTEKIPAFTEAFVAGTLSALSGDQPERVGRVTLEPLSDTARNNRVRLAQYGPRLPGLPLAQADRT